MAGRQPLQCFMRSLEVAQITIQLPSRIKVHDRAMLTSRLNIRGNRDLQLASSELCWAAPDISGSRLEAKQLMANLSKTQIDRLGDRLREGTPSESDLRLLDEYRRSFGEAYETVVRTIREELQLEPTGRPAKSTSSLIEKLHRESIRLSQVQDIAGCRLLVANIVEQEQVVTSLCAAFPGASVVDRRAKPSYGYRAVHVVAQITGKLVEIQVRTPLQHLWAELSEKLSDVVDPTIKYGGDSNLIRRVLARFSENVANLEDLEKRISHIQGQSVHEKLLQTLREEMASLKKDIADALGDAINWVETQIGQKR